MGDTEEWCGSFTAAVSGVRVYFIEFRTYFDRQGLYHDPEPRVGRKRLRGAWAAAVRIGIERYVDRSVAIA